MEKKKSNIIVKLNLFLLGVLVGIALCYCMMDRFHIQEEPVLMTHPLTIGV